MENVAFAVQYSGINIPVHIFVDTMVLVLYIDCVIYAPRSALFLRCGDNHARSLRFVPKIPVPARPEVIRACRVSSRRTCTFPASGLMRGLVRSVDCHTAGNVVERDSQAAIEI